MPVRATGELYIIFSAVVTELIERGKNGLSIADQITYTNAVCAFVKDFNRKVIVINKSVN